MPRLVLGNLIRIWLQLYLKAGKQRWLSQRQSIALALLLGTAILGTMSVQPSIAQSNNQWAPVQHVPGYQDDALTPELVADQNRSVHAFNSMLVDQQLAIAYSKWRRDRGWTTPVDIVLPVTGQNRMEAAFLDQSGMMHIVYFGGDDLDGDIFYSRAPAVNAGNAQAWTQSIVIGDQAITPEEAALAGDDGANLYGIYAGRVLGHGVYFVQSGDKGETWSEPEPIFLTYSRQLWPSELELYRDNDGRLHALWSLANTAGNSESINYAQFDPTSAQWSEPIQLAEATGIREVDTAKIIEYDGELFVIYHDGEPTTRHMLRSQDDGNSWSGPVRLFPHEGSNGAASLVVDSNNTLHMFFGNRVGLPYANIGFVSGIWHSVWQGDSWSTPYDTIITAPPQARYDPSFANAVVSQGNVILVAWRQDPGHPNRNGVWSTYSLLDAPELPLAIPTADATQTPTTIVASTPIEQVATLPSESAFADGQGGDVPTTGTDPSFPLIMAILSVVVLLSASVVVYWWQRLYRR